MELFFAKYHGLGNDFIIVEAEEIQTFDSEKLAKTLCNRRTGIGADGLIVIKYDPRPEMVFYNSDGSSATMCGNGIRCLANYLYLSGVTDKEYIIKTGAGDMRIEVVSEEPFLVRINMGSPDFTPENIPVVTDKETFINQPFTVGNDTFSVSSVFIGTAHAVVFVDDLDKINIKKTGDAICHHPLFPNRANVNFTQIIDENTLRVRTFERGVGPTLACGSGSCAAAVISHKLGFTGEKVEVQLTLGSLQIEVGGTVYMTGTATKVYDGNIPISNL